MRQITEYYQRISTLMAGTLIWDVCAVLTTPPQQPGLQAREEVKPS